MYCTILDKSKQRSELLVKSSLSNSIFARVDVYYDGKTYELFIRPINGGIYAFESATSEKEAYTRIYERIIKILKEKLKRTEDELKHLKKLEDYSD